MLNLKYSSSLLQLRSGSKTFLAILGVAAASVLTAHGQIIWGGGNTVTANSDISLAGSYVDAAGNFNGGGGTVAVNATTNVVFNGLTFDSTTTTYKDGHNITFSNITGDNGGDSYGGSSPGVQSDYRKVMTGVAYTFATGTVTLSNLVVGQEYQVQVWKAMIGGNSTTTFTSVGGNSVTVDVSDSDYILGTFTAGASQTQDFTFTGSPGEINTIQLRAIPEPSTFALMAGGLGALAFFARRRGLLVSGL